MSIVADNAVVADDPISNGHQVHDGAISFETPSKLVTDGEVVEAISNGVQESALDAEDISGVGDKTDDTLVTASSDDTLAAETSVEVLIVGKSVDDMGPEAPALYTSDSDKENTTLIHDSELLANGHHKSLFVEESEQLTNLTIAPCNKPASLAEPVQEDAIDFSSTVISEIPKDYLPITDSPGTEIPYLDVATIVVEPSKVSLDDGEPPIAVSTGPDTSLSDFVTTSINGIGSTTAAEPSHCQDETPISHLSTEMSPTADILEEVVVPPAIEAEEISPMAAEPEPAVVEVACDPIEAEASPIEVEASSVGDEPAVTEAVPAFIDSVAETAPEGENISDEQESTLVEAESGLVETQSSTAEPGITPMTLEAAPIKRTLCEVVVEESLAYEPDVELATILEPTPEATELEPIKDTVESGTEVAESDPTKETVPVTEAVATAAPAEMSGAEAEESVVEACITAEKEANGELQGVIDAEDEPAAPTEPEVGVFVPEVISVPAEAATGSDVLSTESKEAAITPTSAPEALVESIVAVEAESVDAHDSVTGDSDPITAPDTEPIIATETDSVAAGSEPATVESEVPAAVDAELTELAVESIVVETVQIDVEPPSSNVSFVEDPEVDFAYDDEPQTPLAEETHVFEEPVLDANGVGSEVQVEESSVEETVEIIPIDVVIPAGESASLEEAAAEEVVAVEEVITVEESPVEEPAAVEETVLVEETTAVEEPAAVEETVLVEETTTVEVTIPADEVVPVGVATGELAPVEEVPSVEAVAVEERAPVEEITLVEEITPIESAAPIESSPPVEEAVVGEVEPTIEELAVPVDDGSVLEEAMPSVYAAGVGAPLPSVVAPSPEEPAISIEEPLAVPEEAFAETAAPAIEEISLAGDASTVEETSAPPVEVPVEDVPAVDVSESARTEELSTLVEEHTSGAVEDTPGREDQPVAIEVILADAVKPVSVDDRIPPTMDETPLLAGVHSDTDGPALKATSTTEEPSVPKEEPVTVVVSGVTISEVAVVASVEEDILVVEGPLVPSNVEVREPVVHEETAAPTGDHELVAVEDAPVPDDQPLTIEETPVTEEAPVSLDQIPPAMNETPPIVEVPSAADEPALDDGPNTEEPSAPEDESTTASTVEVPPTAEEVTAAPEEITSKAEEAIPVFEAAPTTPAHSIFDDTSSPEETTIFAEESTVESDASVTELPVTVEEPAPAASEVSVVEVVLEEVHAALEHTEDALFTSEETKDEIEDPQHADTPVSLPEQSFVEESFPTAPIVEEFTPVPAEEPDILEQLHVVTSQFPVNGEHSEVDKDLEPPIAHLETSSEIEETKAVEQPETTVVEGVPEQQEIATSPALNVVTDIERPKSPWTPSYSVITQGPGVPVEEHVNVYDGDNDDAAPAQSQTPEIIIDEVAAVVPEITADVEVFGQSHVEVLQLTEEQVTSGEVEEAHLKSPWTPSYSVTVQGNVAQTNEGLDDLEQLPPSAAQFVAVEGFEEQPVPFTETLISGEVTSSTTVVADIHATLSATLDESDIPDSAAEAEALHDVASEQGVIAQAEPSVPTPPEPPTVEEVPEEIEQGSFIVDDESTQLCATDPDGEGSSSSWTPSYSVTGLEPASAPDDQVAVKDGEFVEHGSFIIETQPPAVVEDAPEVKSDSGLLTPVDDPVGERPKSPWTPSYSVTKQGPNDTVEEVEELDKLEHLPGPLSSILALAADEEPIPPVLITETLASVDEPTMAETPLYLEGDVTVSELSETHDNVEASGALITRETPQTFPILEEPQKIARKPSLSAVDELNAAEVTESSTLRIDIPTNNGANRNRLESTTSSRFFPGGWFSSSPKVPEERTSLDVAAGEFVHKSSVENTPTTAIPSAVEEDKEKKSRWCTIM